MAFYGRFGVDGEFLELLRNPSPVPGDAVALSKTELFQLLSTNGATIRRLGGVLQDYPNPDYSVPRWPTDPDIADRIAQARQWLRLTEELAQEFIEQRLAIMMGSTEITDTRLPQAYGLKLLEFRDKLRQFLSKSVSLSDVVPTPPDD